MTAIAVTLAFEGGLALVALAAGWSLGYSPLRAIPVGVGLAAHARAVGVGVIATVPLLLTLFAALVASERHGSGPFRELRLLTEQLLPPLFSGTSIAQLGAVSIFAGLGEELLFRGLIQSGLATYLAGIGGPVLPLLVASTLFGLAHPISRRYVIVAGLVGLYLGTLLHFTGNLLAPVTTHALYDWIALVTLLRRRPAREPGRASAQ